ncbi:OmpP1/FadL family transporter [Marinobacter persicus]|jgi:long-chain fatty acid transport protein|uniref:Long-chain fatty acid transport protein n=1 Tax=Marinobacter persicus TaxID=930118 RepID=A0A2S6G6K0_9GAMM|nr:outer membrane protein transport protein [Marinobacter persicus]PPK51446.1 long-chain fatty acid transport protein [Marinobacter persicus]PPK54774.1 long-chain fatty acid transport protein [Marinobacter persicus]PPK58133.1 long-chain fatty acid transport protein [Marinobacter persicus]
MNNKYNTLAKAVRFATLAAIATPATVMAGGFSLNEQSAATSGYANAGAAAHAEDASTVFFNPAGMSKLSGTNVSFGASVLDIDAEAKGGTIVATDQVGDNVTGSNGGDIADPAVLPSLFVTHEVSDSIDVGFALHAPYGLAADYEDDFRGRYFADETELSVISFAPSISASNGEGLSMGIGMNIMYAEGKLSRFIDNSYIQSQLGPAGPLYPDQGYANVEGDDVGVTFRVGFLYDLTDKTQLGLNLQTGTELELEGDAEFTNVVTPANAGGGPSGNFDFTRDAKVPLNIPESAMLGVSHQLTDDLTLLAGATYARWSRFEELDVINKQDGSIITHVTEQWKNTWQFNVGGIWQATSNWKLKAGYAYDESPVDEFVTARIPSQDRHWLTLGTQWKDSQSGWAVDAAVGTLIFDGDAKVNEYKYEHGGEPDDRAQLGGQDDPSNYQAEYDLSAWSASLQVSKAF